MSNDVTHFVIVDDNVDELTLNKAILLHRSRNYEVSIVSDPTRLIPTLVNLRAATHQAEIVVLLDIRMPRVNGFELIYDIRNTIETYGLRILMLSASNSSVDREEASAIGADGFISKPLSVEKLERALLQVN